ncbi:MAG: segregation/condensation protein A [Candidatus Omnitrophota bacterium]
MTYKVKLEIFEGPLDLLLYLIKKSELNIQDIAIAAITDQYLQYMDLMRMLDLDIAGEFLVMAATLIHIKSKMLLPPDESEEEQEEEDPRAELVKKLLEYRKFKEAAENLKDMEARRKDVFVRPSIKDEVEGLPSEELYFEASIFDLLSAFSKVLKEVKKEAFYEVFKDEVTVADKIHEIFHRLVKNNVIYFLDLFNKARSKLEIIATFLALLELIRMKEVITKQDKVFGDIKIVRNTQRMIPPKLNEVENERTETEESKRAGSGYQRSGDSSGGGSKSGYDPGAEHSAGTVRPGEHPVE